VTRGRWFLPESADILGILARQAAVTVEGTAALVAWAGGDEAKAREVRDAEHRADDVRRELQTALTTSFSTPLEPEDLFAISRGLDEVVNGAKNAVREAEVMAMHGDPHLAAMAATIHRGTLSLAEAVPALKSDRAAATAAAEAAVHSQRDLERAYRPAMAELLETDDLREVLGRRELYRRLARIGDVLAAVAERVLYAVLKES
jgi:uncharacterized protein